ncbi:MAG: polysaccharide pyruvyl transferase CsaB [Synechococcus sp.]|nr:polysaccharide pyruvyl transferase CsaB [Synechococcus sp.]
MHERSVAEKITNIDPARMRCSSVGDSRLVRETRQQGLIGSVAPNHRRLLLCGYYGEHNLGDDALLEVLLCQLPPGSQAVVTAHDQGLVQERFGVETVQRRSLGLVLKALRGCDVLVLGGGSLLQDSTSFASLLYYAALIVVARFDAKPVLLWGQGLGPLRRRRSRLLVARLLGLVTAATWRDPESAALARRLGFEGLVGSDPVWALPPQPWRGKGGPLVLCLRPTSQLQGMAWQPYLDAIDQLACQTDREVLWLPFHAEQDRGLLAQLGQEHLLPPGLAARSREVWAERPDEAMAVFSSAGLVVAMRLHGLILAALSGAPCAALSYDPKVAAAAMALACPCQSLDQPPADDLLTSWSAILDTPPPADRLTNLRSGTAVHRRLLAGAGDHGPEAAINPAEAP